METGSGKRIIADLMREDVSLESIGEVLAELLYANAVLGRMFSVLPLPILLVDRDGRIVSATPQALSDVLGMAQDDVIGDHFVCVGEHCAADLAQVMEAGAAIVGGEKWQGIMAMKCGAEWLVQVQPLDDSEETCRILLVTFEAPLASSQSAKLFGAARVEKQDRFIHMGELSGGVIHEVKNLLQNIGGHIQLMQLKYPEDEGVQSFAGLIDNELTMANSLVMGFLGMSRMDVKISEHSLNDVVRDVMIMMYGHCHVRGIEVAEEFAEFMPNIYMDEQRIKQVVINFVGNSIDAIEERRKSQPGFAGAIRIVTEYQPAAGPDEPEFVHLIFEDDGIGMTDDVLQNFCKPFFTTKESGHGMGTSICAAIIHLHGGYIRVKSKPGEGCKIKVSLPCQLPRAIENGALLNEIATMMEQI